MFFTLRFFTLLTKATAAPAHTHTQHTHTAAVRGCVCAKPPPQMPTSLRPAAAGPARPAHAAPRVTHVGRRLTHLHRPLPPHVHAIGPTPPQATDEAASDAAAAAVVGAEINVSPVGVVTTLPDDTAAGTTPHVASTPSPPAAAPAAGWRALLSSPHDAAIVGLAVPALGSLLLDPILSLVDTSECERGSWMVVRERREGDNAVKDAARTPDSGGSATAPLSLPPPPCAFNNLPSFHTTPSQVSSAASAPTNWPPSACPPSRSHFLPSCSTSSSLPPRPPSRPPPPAATMTKSPLSTRAVCG